MRHCITLGLAHRKCSIKVRGCYFPREAFIYACLRSPAGGRATSLRPASLSHTWDTCYCVSSASATKLESHGFGGSRILFIHPTAQFLTIRVSFMGPVGFGLPWELECC